MGFELELLPECFWNSKSSHRGFAFGSKSCHRRLSLSLNKLLCVGCSSESKEVSVWDSIFFISQVLMNFESFIVFEKILGIHSSGPQILPSFANVPLFIEKEWTCCPKPALQRNDKIM